MQKNTEVLITIAVLALVAVAAFAFYRWRQRQRVRRIETWVRDYLCAAYTVLPQHLSINCSDDPLWPVLVAFDPPHAGVRRTLQFMCAGAPSTYSLFSEKEERR